MNKKLLIILSVILSITFIAAHLFFGYCFRFDNICFAARTDTGSFVVNDDGSKIKLFKMSGTRIDQADSCISYKKIFESSDGELGYNRPLDIVENNGKLYLLNIKSFFSERFPEYEICLLDFNSRRSEVVFSFSQEELNQKAKNFFEEEKASDPESDYIVCGRTFGIDDEGIILYLAEQSSEYRGMNSVYQCKLIAGEIGSAEQVSEYRTDQIDEIVIVGNNILQFDSGYHIMINGQNSSPLAEERYSAFFKYNEGSVIGKSIDRNEFYCIDIAGETQTAFTDLNELIESKSLSFSDISNIYTVGDRIIPVCSDGEKSFLYDIDSNKKIGSIYTESIAELILHSLAFAAAAAAAVWLAGALIHMLRTRGRVPVKFAALVIPVMFGCDLAAYVVIGIGMDVIEDNILQKSLRAVSTQYSSLALTDDIGDFNYEGEYNENVSRFIQILADSKYLKAMYWAEDSGISTDIGYFGYVRGGDTFVTATDIIEGNYSVDVFSLLPSKTSEKIREAIEKPFRQILQDL